MPLILEQLTRRAATELSTGTSAAIATCSQLSIVFQRTHIVHDVYNALTVTTQPALRRGARTHVHAILFPLVRIGLDWFGLLRFRYGPVRFGLRSVRSFFPPRLPSTQTYYAQCITSSSTLQHFFSAAAVVVVVVVVVLVVVVVVVAAAVVVVVS